MSLVTDRHGELSESVLALRHLAAERLQVHVPQPPRGLHGLEQMPRNHGGREVETRRQLANLDPDCLESAQGLIDTLRTPLETQQVYDSLRAGFHREQPVPAFEATDEHLHARLVLAGLRVDPAIAQSFGGNLADEVFGRSPESLRNSRGLELHRELGAAQIVRPLLHT